MRSFATQYCRFELLLWAIERLAMDHLEAPTLGNSFIESAFSTANSASEYPDRFRDDSKVIAYPEKYFDWYDQRHRAGNQRVSPPQQQHNWPTALIPVV